MGNVVEMGKANSSSERRAAFILAVAQSFEKYVADYGYEPDAIVYVMNGIKKSSNIGWHIGGESQEGATTTTVAFAAMHMIAETRVGVVDG